MATLPRQTYRIFEKIEATCEREKLIIPDSLVVAGISGGVDSLLLLAFLVHYRTIVPFRLIACHLNHMIRGQDADLDQQLVESFSKDHEIPFVCVREDVPAYSKQHSIGLEQAGRIIRRETLETIGREYHDRMEISAGFRIALAHHMDDRAESILMHIGRGSGLRGLIGIRYLDGPFIRPLLDIRRAEVVTAAQAMELRWRDDESNSSDEFLRNRIRNTLFPAWEQAIGYDPTASLIRLGALAASDDAALSQIAEDSYDGAILPDQNLSLSVLVSLPQAIASRVLQLYFCQCIEATGREDDPAQYALSERNTNDLIELSATVSAGDKTNGRLSLPGGLEARLADGRMVIISQTGLIGHGNA